MASLMRAALCARCGALCPNSWSDPAGYVVDGDTVYCNQKCADRYAVVTVQGEGETHYHVVDRNAMEELQPAIECSYSTKGHSGAHGCAIYKAECLNGRGYHPPKADPIVACCFGVPRNTGRIQRVC